MNKFNTDLDEVLESSLLEGLGDILRKAYHAGRQYKNIRGKSDSERSKLHDNIKSTMSGEINNQKVDTLFGKVDKSEIGGANSDGDENKVDASKKDNEAEQIPPKEYNKAARNIRTNMTRKDIKALLLVPAIEYKEFRKISKDKKEVDASASLEQG